MNTYQYGHRSSAAVANRSKVACLLICWLVIVGETLFPVSLFLPKSALMIALGSFAVFHLFNAIFMGLNTFVWSFIATYPAVIVLHEWIANGMRGVRVLV